MVRTLDFQSKNVGSIPSGPIIKYVNALPKKNFVNNKTNLLDKKIKYNFLFISLISPFFSSNIHFFDQLSINSKKVLLKQSYILLTWFYYLSFLEIKKNKKNKLKFFVFPTYRRKFTTTKAPMAHKNWSKEQYQFKFFKIKISFIGLLDDETPVNDTNFSLLFILLNKKNFPSFETNLLFLKYYNFLFYFNDFKFFNFYRFIKKKSYLS